jgi:hypothetical protein
VKSATAQDWGEHDLAAAIRDIPDSARGWQAEKTSVQCQSCKAISVFPAERVSQRCDFCGSSALVPYEQAKPPISPESLLPFKFSESNARDAVRKWYGGVWFAPDRLKKAALTDTVKGMYLPYWTFDSRTHCEWTAEAGYYYYETESYTDNSGETQTREVRQVRWEYAAGSLDHFFDDELISASKGITPHLLRAVEPFPTTTDLVKYDPGFLSGWVVEQYQIDLVAGQAPTVSNAPFAIVIGAAGRVGRTLSSRRPRASSTCRRPTPGAASLPLAAGQRGRSIAYASPSPPLPPACPMGPAPRMPAMRPATALTAPMLDGLTPRHTKATTRRRTSGRVGK